ncbi:MAG TPA: hypothetical protein VGF75_06745 [Candidatus Saccharimonadales bacterium]|jgi:hypothetical protein
MDDQSQADTNLLGTIDHDNQAVAGFGTPPTDANDPQAAPPEPAQPSTDTTVNQTNTTGGDVDDLLQIKQQALTQLAPLVGSLDQSPEDRFKTTMMMIQASDNPGLIKDAYEAAEQIEDEKAKAQALLDIVNEINYFSQHNS